jgi:hypothetical protein
MGLLDSLKKTARKAKDKAEDLADQHGDKVKSGIDKVGDAIDKRTKGKHAKNIDKAQDKAKGVVDDLAGQEDTADADGTADAPKAADDTSSDPQA